MDGRVNLRQQHAAKCEHHPASLTEPALTFYQLNESLYVIVQYLKAHFDPQPLNDGTSDPSNVEAVGNILEWASKAALPSIEFELYFSDDSEISGGI